MSEEEKTIPNPEGYTLVKYSEVAVFFCLFISAVMFIPFTEFVLKDGDGSLLVNQWLWWLMYCVFCLIGLAIGHKLTETKVNLKLSEKGLEQTRLSGSRFVPEYRLITWGDMKRFHLHGRNKSVEFLICTKEGPNFRISMPSIRLFERQKSNYAVLDAFRTEFKQVAKEHGVFPAFSKHNR